MSSLNIVIIETSSSDKTLKNTLEDAGYQVLSLSTSTLNYERIKLINPDIIIFNVAKPQQDTFQIIININQQYRLPVILFSEDQDTETINKVIKAGASAYIVDGIEAKRIKSIINIAIARFKEQLALKDELAETKSKLEDRISIDKAKAILIKTQGFTENEAYHSLRKLAMKRNIAISEMAKNVIAMTELFSAEQ